MELNVILSSIIILLYIISWKFKLQSAESDKEVNGHGGVFQSAYSNRILISILAWASARRMYQSACIVDSKGLD
jgi:hypothetical protein